MESSSSSSGARRWIASSGLVAAVVLVLPPVVFAIVRPDWYFIQNGLDPFFYTGYVQNFDNIFHAVGARHYFISRWSIYLPQRVLLSLFGDPTAAYLVMRWIAASVVLASVALFGARRWHRWDGVAVGVVVLLMPMSIRGLMTDYSDAVVFPLGLMALALAARWPEHRAAATSIGALFGLIVVANPFGATLIVAMVPFWLLRVTRSRWVAILSFAAAGGSAVLGIGWLLFRVRYGIGNVYGPTLDFLREQGTLRDPLKSPELTWLGYRLWIYLPPALVVLFQVLHRWAGVRFDVETHFVVRTMTLQYVIQVAYQFLRNGSTLEIPYYWHYILPSFALSCCAIVCAVARESGTWTVPSIAGVTVIVTAFVGTPTPEILPWWGIGLGVLVLSLLIAWRFVGRRPAAVAAVVVFVLFAAQVGAPRPEPILVDELRVLSSYELVYDDASDGVRSFEIVSWFDAQMETMPVPVQRSAVFWYDSPIGARMAAMYGAQVSGRWLIPIIGSTPPTEPFPLDLTNAISAGQIPTIVAIGSQEMVDALQVQFETAEPAMSELLHIDVPGEPDMVLEVISSLGT